MSKKIRKTFSAQDDNDLLTLIETFGVDNWSVVSSQMPLGFTPRQCRERWKNYLNPQLEHTAWTQEEDKRLIDEYNQLGARWIPISKLFPGRSGNAIRNRVFLLLRKKDREKKVGLFPIPILQLEQPRLQMTEESSELGDSFSFCEAAQLWDLDSETMIRFFDHTDEQH
jgi:hypothetical protein